MKTTKQRGFTLYELLTTMLIVGVVLALGVPNMQQFRQNSRMTAAANDLHSSFHLARTEASRAKTNVSICATATPMAAAPTCGGELEAGWIVFTDFNGDSTVNGADSVLHRYPAVGNGIVINTTGPDDYFTFASTGLGRGNAMTGGFAGTPALNTMVLCDDRGNVQAGSGKSAARALIVTPLGRATVLADVSQVTFHGGC